GYTGRVGVNTTTPISLFDVDGGTRASTGNGLVSFRTTYTGTTSELAQALSITFQDSKIVANLTTQVLRLTYIKSAGAVNSAGGGDVGILIAPFFNESSDT